MAAKGPSGSLLHAAGHCGDVSLRQAHLTLGRARAFCQQGAAGVQCADRPGGLAVPLLTGRFRIRRSPAGIDRRGAVSRQGPDLALPHFADDARPAHQIALQRALATGGVEGVQGSGRGAQDLVGAKANGVDPGGGGGQGGEEEGKDSGVVHGTVSLQKGQAKLEPDIARVKQLLRALYFEAFVRPSDMTLVKGFCVVYRLRMNRNVVLYPWFKFVQQLVFWQATWFLYFEDRLSASAAILLYMISDICTTALEVPSGYMSDRIGRRITLIAAASCGAGAALMLVLGDGFAAFALASVLLGAAGAFASGTDSALLFESLKADSRAAEIGAAELKAWRYSFTALALSALTGGVLARVDDRLPYVATAMSALVLLAITALFREPPHAPSASHRDDLRAIRTSLTQPILLWLLCLTILMYVFSHIPFVFGQPFIREALTTAGYAAQTPLVSGGVTFLMMMISVAVSLMALPLRRRLGLPGILLLAFGIQIALTAALAISNSLFVIGLLLFRMVPDSLSQPFIRARIQPLLGDNIRATWFSLQSLAGRLLFAATLGLAAAKTSGAASMPYSDMQVILAAYAAFGLVFLSGLALTARSVRE